MIHIRRSIKRSTLITALILVGRKPETPVEMYACTLIDFPFPHQTRIHRPAFRSTLIGRSRILIATRQILFPIHGSDISIPVQVIVHISGQRKLLAELARHIQPDRIIDIVLISAILIAIGRTGHKRKILSVLIKIIHLSFQVLLFIISISYRRIRQPSLVQFIFSLKIKHILFLSRTDSGKLFFF